MHTQDTPPLRGDAGVTLLELLITSAILALLVSLAIPHVRSFIEVQRLKNSGEAIMGDLRYARTEAIKRHSPVTMTFSTDGAYVWHYVALPDLLGDKSSTRFPDVKMIQVTFIDNSITFDPIRGTTSSVGYVHLSAANDTAQLRINVGILGQTSICTPATIRTGHYPPC